MGRRRAFALLAVSVAGQLGCSSQRSDHAAATPPVDPASAERGNVAFHDRVLAGLGANGRACADCHVDADDFQLSPASAEKRFQQMADSGVDDPLFRPLDADDYEDSCESASDFSNLRENGLIRIRMQLPDNIKVVDPASCKTDGAPAPCETATAYSLSPAPYADVWRAVPSILNVSLTGPDSQSAPWPRGPNAQGGYQLDARIDTLQNQAGGAFTGHAGATTAPDPGMLDDIAAYETTLAADAEPPLDELETKGKTVFNRACGQCHGGPGMSTPIRQPQPMLRFFDDLNACPRPVDAESPARWNLGACPPALARNERTYEISFADGFKMLATSSDPGRALLSGFVFSGPPADDGSCLHPPCGEPQHDDWQKLDVAPLHGISKTAPYFHNNSAATLEEVVIHYEEFYRQISALHPAPDLPPVLTTDNVHRDRQNVPAEREALVAYLKRL